MFPVSIFFGEKLNVESKTQNKFLQNGAVKDKVFAQNFT
jgi:hypothetical protein